MLIPFSNLPEDARIWIYQSSRAFSGEEVKLIEKKTRSFLSQWTAHNQPLHAGFEMPYNRFVVIGIDQSKVPASGCSIDACVHFIQAMEREFNTDLLDKMNVTFKQGEYIVYKPLAEFRKMANSHAVSKKTIVFNNLVDSKGAYLSNWEVPASESWHSSFIK